MRFVETGSEYHGCMHRPVYSSASPVLMNAVLLELSNSEATYFLVGLSTLDALQN